MLTPQLLDSLNGLSPVSPAYQNCLELEKPFAFKPCKKGALILLPGKDADELHFVGKGLFILYCYGPDAEEELILDFFWPGTFIMLPVDFYERSRNRKYYIKAIDNSQLFSISRDDMEGICQRFPEAKIHCDKIRSRILQRMMDRLQLMFYPKEERYEPFVHLYPKVSPMLKEHMTSLFLGTCIKTVSRSKNKRKGGKGTFDD